MKPYNRLTDEDKKNIVEEYYNKKEYTKKELAEYCNVSIRAVARVLKENGINTKLKNKYTLDENYFETIDTEEKAYWLGFLYADGYVGNDKYNNIVIGLCEKDKKHLENFKKSINYSGDIRIKKNSGGYKTKHEGVVINFSNKKMASDLRKLGLYPGKSTTMKDMPDIPDNLYRHFIRGYFDGDGSISHIIRNDKYKGHRFIMTMIGTIDFLNKISEKLPIKTYKKLCSKTTNMQYLRCQDKEDMKKLYHYFYDDSTIHLDRKYEIWKDIINY